MIPCKNCITFPMCRNKILEHLKFDGDSTRPDHVVITFGYVHIECPAIKEYFNANLGDDDFDEEHFRIFTTKTPNYMDE
jgi:hypothetical protein